MPLEFQRSMAAIFLNQWIFSFFIDNELIVKKGAKQEFQKSDEITSWLEAERNKVAENNIQWLGHKFSKAGLVSLDEKIQAV